ncbi:hypothetical protein TNCV_495911 [Trichonephila clavipes]|nr:hypothetical protein TNCV_495911 [Trichonephila clavipes]
MVSEKKHNTPPEHLDTLVGCTALSARTVQRELHASNLYGRVGIRKPLVTARHALQRRQWCRTHRQWTPNSGNKSSGWMNRR